MSVFVRIVKYNWSNQELCLIKKIKKKRGINVCVYKSDECMCESMCIYV